MSDRTPSWDEQIRWRLLRGEESALGELYDRFAPLVHGLAGLILDDLDAAEQLTREVFAQLWQHPAAYDPARGSLRAWLGTLTQRRAVERLRSQRGDDPEVEARATAARVQYMVAALPEPLRETIAVGWYDGLRYPETARRLGITEQAAKHRMRLGLQLISSALAGQDGPDAGGCPGPAR
ncbi:sigma factor [Kitasatospora sp. NPDC088346]|uniref:sigma factor n=1 Tax=Kitasatospora sp. NPDC088346 TaxID=3364073 RepID=UPI00381C38CD